MPTLAELPHHTKLPSLSPLVSQDCVTCHTQQTNEWKQSDHFQSMSIPSPVSVRANFLDTQVNHFSQSARFSMNDGKYLVSISDASGGPEVSYEIKYTFGFSPLQQYLVETSPGTLQVLPFAWDTRTLEEGGQRWFHQYPNEDIKANDRFHWRQPLQNWNGMCADCHSDELVRKYDAKENQFTSSYSGVNVGCVSCHGNNHENILQQASRQVKTQAGWLLVPGKKTAMWTDLTGVNEKPAVRDNQFMQNCFACHALRTPLTDGFSAGQEPNAQTFLDKFLPQFITSPSYHADGQINEEVYVYGSFLQSKMYQNQVNCIDCHEAHTMKLKVQGNGLCLQCHAAASFDVPEHVRHQPNSDGAKCVNCHMPDKVFMGVDKRRDHSFKIPRPDLSDQFNTPNACVACHDDKSNEWATQALVEWFGAPDKLSDTQLNVLRLRHGEVLSLEQHKAIIEDAMLPAIVRASAIELLQPHHTNLGGTWLSKVFSSREDLVRLAAAKVANVVALPQRIALLSPLLSDPRKAIRITAANALLTLPLASVSGDAYRTAFSELLVYEKNQLWRGEGRVNQADRLLRMKVYDQAEGAFKQSIAVDPHFDAGFVNLADFYRAQQKEELVFKILQEGLEQNPRSADVLYAYGLAMIRAKDQNKALTYFRQAMQLNELNSQFAYAYVLTLDSLSSGDALPALISLLPSYENSKALLELGLFLSKKYKMKAQYGFFAKKLAELNTDLH